MSRSLAGSHSQVCANRRHHLPPRTPVERVIGIMRRGGVENNITALSMLGSHGMVKIDQVDCAGDTVDIGSDGHDGGCARGRMRWAGNNSVLEQDQQARGWLGATYTCTWRVTPCHDSLLLIRR